MMKDDDTDRAGGPEFTALINGLRALIRKRQDVTIAKAEAARRNASEVMRKAASLFAEGRISAHDLSTLHAVRMRLDLALPAWERS